jgi:hypothetical protein
MVATLLGSVITATFLVLLTFVTGQRTGLLFPIWGLAVAAAYSWTSVRAPELESFPWADLVAMGAIAFAIGIWCRGVAGAVSTVESSGILPVWVDYYFHGAIAAQLGDPHVAGHCALMMANTPPIFYHYGMYVIPAALLEIVHTSGLLVATAIMLPLGLLLAAWAVLLVTEEIAQDQRAGVAALAFLLLAPDASHYALANGFYGFHWLLFTNPGSGWGIAAASCALLFLCIWLREQNRGALILAGILTVCVFQFRAQIFVWFAPVVVTLVFSLSGFGRRHRRGILVLSGLSVLAVLVVLAWSEAAQKFWFSHSAIVAYLNFVLGHDASFMGLGGYGWLVAKLGQVPAIFAGTLLLVPAMLGALLLVYLLALVAGRLRTRWQPIDTVPGLLLFFGAAVTLFAPLAPSGDPTEFQHRPFVLLYTVVAIWTAAHFFRRTTAVRVTNSQGRSCGFVILVLAVAAASFGAAVNPARPSFDWGKAFYGARLKPGVVPAAQVLRHAVHRSQIVAVGPIDPKGSLFDPALAFASLADAPVYLAAVQLQLFYGDKRTQTAEGRLQFQQEVEASDDWEKAMALLCQNHIDWYVWLGNTGPPFDMERRYPVASDHDMAIYRINSSDAKTRGKTEPAVHENKTQL